MNTQEILQSTQSALNAGRVFGDVIQVDGTTILPAAFVSGGAGGGQGRGEEGGAGFGLRARPAGVFAIRDGHVSWRPALNVNLIILGGQIVGLAAILSARSVLRAWLRHRGAVQTPPAL